MKRIARLFIATAVLGSMAGLVRPAQADTCFACQVSVGDAVRSEYRSSQWDFGLMFFKVSLAFPVDHTVTVKWTTGQLQDQATVYEDYQHTYGTVTFQAGETSHMVGVSIINDTTTYEPNELLSVRLYDAVGASITDNVGLGTILDDDPSRASVLKTSAWEDEGKLTFPVRLSAPLDHDAWVLVNTYESSAKAGTDFHSTSQWMYFAAGQTSRQFEVMLVDDVNPESTEAMTARIVDRIGVGTAGIAANGTIYDGDVV
jgi:hypothetical protein